VCQESSRAHVGVRGYVCGKSSWVSNFWLSGGIARSVSCVSVELVGWCGSTCLTLWRELWVSRCSLFGVIARSVSCVRVGFVG